MGNSVRRGDLLRLAGHLQRRREVLLRTWREAVAADPKITTDATLARSQFVDHVPRILDAFEQQLRAREEAEQAAAAEAQREGAANHGIHRWLHGYHYKETMREWGHLQSSLAHEVEVFTLADADLDPRAMSVARELLTQLFVECMVESAAGHVRLQETEAASRLRDLEQVLTSLRSLEQERAQLWREAAHDLRGNVGAVQMAATLLARGSAQSARQDEAKTVERTAKALTTLLDDLVELARLEAGREQRKISKFDAADLIREICGAFQPTAADHGLFLTWDAPPSLPVAGDATKVHRIVQNLVLNAIKYTEEGGVQVSVAALEVGVVASWELQVQDTGVGIADRSSPAIARMLRAATQESDALTAESSHPPLEESLTLPSESSAIPHTASGEGVGLAIVKRLCELLDATIEVATAQGRGTTVRIVFPQQYPG